MQKIRIFSCWLDPLSWFFYKIWLIEFWSEILVEVLRRFFLKIGIQVPPNFLENPFKKSSRKSRYKIAQNCNGFSDQVTNLTPNEIPGKTWNSKFAKRTQKDRKEEIYQQKKESISIFLFFFYFYLFFLFLFNFFFH